MAERSVKTIKDLLRKESSLEDVLLAYRAIPLASGFSPLRLMFGRRIHSNLGFRVDQNTDYLKGREGLFKEKDFFQSSRRGQAVA